MEGAAQGPRFTSRLQAEAKRVEDHGRISTGTPTDIQPVAHFPQTDPQLIQQLNQKNDEVQQNFTAVGQTFVQAQEAFRNMDQRMDHEVKPTSSLMTNQLQMYFLQKVA